MSNQLIDSDRISTLELEIKVLEKRINELEDVLKSMSNELEHKIKSDILDDLCEAFNE